MGILDEAIKEHLELKRQHGADASELTQLEDEAFGAAERPGDGGSSPEPLAEAATEFMQQPETPQGEDPPEAAEEGPARRELRAEIADLQEAPPPEPEEPAGEPAPPEEKHAEEPAGEPAPPEEKQPEEKQAEDEGPAEEEPPALEHEAVTEPPSEPQPPTGPTTEEGEALVEQPTETYDVEEGIASSQVEAPSEEELVEEEIDEPRLAPVDPLSGIDEGGEEKEEEEEADDFFDEKRLSDELDEALEAPGEAEDEGKDGEGEKGAEHEDDSEAEEQSPGRHEEDVLEETPDFLEETPEDDRLWFEQKPPKDFDFDD